MLKITASNVSVMVSDMDRSVKFYESIGLTVKQRWENHYAMLEAPGITIGLHPGKEPAADSSDISIGFMIESAAEAKALLQKLNIPFDEKEDKGAGILINFQDPDGTWLYFNQPSW